MSEKSRYRSDGVMHATVNGIRIQEVFFRALARQRLAAAGTGSFFKKYYRWVIIGAVFLILGFTTDIMGDWLGLSEDMTDSLHHAELLIFGIMFVYAARILPKEAAEYLKEGK